MKIYFRLLSYIRPLGIKGPLYFISIFFQTIFSTINFVIIIPLLDVLFKDVDTLAKDSKVVETIVDPSISIDYLIYTFNIYLNETIENFGREGALKSICLLLIGSVVIANIFRYAAAMIKASFRSSLIYNLRNHLFHRIVTFHLGYFTTNRRGDLISRGINDVNQAQSTVIDTASNFVKEPFQIVVYFIALFQISIELTLYTMLILPISGVVIGTISKKLKDRASRTYESLSDLGNIIDEAIGGIRIVKAFTAEKFVQTKFSKELKVYSRHLYKYSEKFELAGPISEFLGVAAVAGILYLGGLLVINHSSSLEASQFIGFIALFSQVLTPAKALSKSVSGVQNGIAAGERVFELIDTTSEIKDVANAKVLDSFEQSIAFENVSFSYGHEKVLNDISFEVKKGETIALVGPSGGGKSTLADLIPRFYDVGKGKIVIDGTGIKDYTTESYRGLFGIVTQESVLFNDTIFNNIAFGVANATEADIVNAAKIANAQDFIVELEDQYQTNIGERGSKLSGGQKQRISIARAILKDPEVLILDEATSALDSESEFLVQEALKKVMENRTSIVIAHRLSTIQHADKILVIQNGQIVEEGTHQQLVAGEGLYKKLTQIQSI